MRIVFGPLSRGIKPRAFDYARDVLHTIVAVSKDILSLISQALRKSTKLGMIHIAARYKRWVPTSMMRIFDEECIEFVTQYIYMAFTR